MLIVFILRYLKGTVSTGIFHRNNPDKNGDEEVLHFVHGSMEVGVSSFVPVIIYRSVSKYVVELKFFFSLNYRSFSVERYNTHTF